MSTIEEKLTLANDNVPKVYAAGESSVDLSNYVQKTDVATSTTLGLVKVASISGINLESDGDICITAASEEEILARNETCRPIVPATINNAVKAALSDDNRINDMTDTEKSNAREVIGAVGFTDYATAEKAGVVKVGDYRYSGLYVDDGELYGYSASEEDIDNRNVFGHLDEYCPITTNNLDYAVRSVRPNVVSNANQDITVNCNANTIYVFGNDLNVTSLSITLPATGKYGDFIQVDFYSDSSSPTNLTITSNAGFTSYDLIPQGDCIYSLYFDWGMSYADASDPYGWRFGYAEYPYEEV